MAPATKAKITPSSGVHMLHTPTNSIKDKSLPHYGRRASALGSQKHDFQTPTPICTRKRHLTSTDSTSSGSDRPLAILSAQQSNTINPKKRPRLTMIQEQTATSNQLGPVEDMQMKTVSFNVSSSLAAKDMSARTGGWIDVKYSEMFIEFIKQGILSEEFIRGFFPFTSQPDNQTANIPLPKIPHNKSTSPIPEAFELTPAQHIEEVMHDKNFRKAKVLGLYGHGELEINGRTATFKIVAPAERCLQCQELKRDCYCVEEDQYFIGLGCAGCKQRGKAYSFNNSKKDEDKYDGSALLSSEPCMPERYERSTPCSV